MAGLFSEFYGILQNAVTFARNEVTVERSEWILS